MIMTKNADADTIMNMNTNIIITTMTKNADVDADMTIIMSIITTIIMQMKYLQAGVKKHLRNIRKKNWKKSEIREGSADYTGRICVIGSKLKEDELEGLFF